MVALCARCVFAPVRAKGLCAACYGHRARTGEDRPVTAILRHIERTLEAEQLAETARVRRVATWEAEWAAADRW